MAKSSANLVLRFGDLEIKTRLFKTNKHQPVPEKKIHGKCGNEISHKQLCPECNGLTEEREASSAGKTKKKAQKSGKAGKAKKSSSKNVGTQPPVLGTSAERPLKSIYCINSKCGGLLEGKIDAEPYCIECDQKLTGRDIARRFKVGEEHIQLPTKVIKAVDELRLGNEIRVLDVRPRTQVPGPLHQGETYQLVPGKGAEYHFLVLQDAMQRKQKLCLFVALKISNEYCGVITLDEGMLLLTLLYPKREVVRQTVDFGGMTSKPGDVRAMSKVLELASDSSSAREEFETLDTPANHFFHAAVAAHQKGKSVTPRKPSRAEEQTLSLTAQLMSTLSESSKAQKAAKKKTKKKVAAR